VNLSPSPGLRALVDANAPLWGAEAEVCRTYFHSPARNAETDCLWITRQCYKELVDGALFRMLAMQGRFRLDELTPGGVSADEGTCTELAHFLAYAEALRAVTGDRSASIDMASLLAGNWPENEQLMALRKTHRDARLELGWRAHAFTEGGYCTLYSTGMELGDRRGNASTSGDQAIAAASKLVFADEWEHMLEGIAGLGKHPLSEADWEQLCDMTVEQSRMRIHMRNGQFGYPVDDARIAELLAGEGAPVRFDWERAGFISPAP
jgi:hypothetical protein